MQRRRDTPISGDLLRSPGPDLRNTIPSTGTLGVTQAEGGVTLWGQARIHCSVVRGRYANSSGSYHFRFFQWFVEVTCASTAERADICARQERRHQ